MACAQRRAGLLLTGALCGVVKSDRRMIEECRQADLTVLVVKTPLNSGKSTIFGGLCLWICLFSKADHVSRKDAVIKPQVN